MTVDTDVLCVDECGRPATEARPDADGVDELVCRYHWWMPEGDKTSRAIEPHRYTLTRGGWDPTLPSFPMWEGERPPGDLVWIMLNPSTASDVADDNTIRRVIGFSQRFGYARAVVVNLFAYRTSDPDRLRRERHAGVDVVGPHNDEVIELAATYGQTVVAGWGAQPGIADRARQVREIVERTGKPLHCLGTTQRGDPRHPLFMPGSSTLSVWSPWA